MERTCWVVRERVAARTGEDWEGAGVEVVMVLLWVLSGFDTGWRLSFDHPRSDSSSRKRAQVKSTPPPGMIAPSSSPRTAALTPSTTSSSLVHPMQKEAMAPKFRSGAPWSMIAPIL